MATSKSRKSAARKSSSSKKKTASPAKRASRPQMPDVIYAQASPRSIGGVSLFEAHGQINAQTVVNFVSEESRNEAAVEMLQQAGFDVLQVSEFTINIAGPRAAYEAAFNTKLTIESKPAIKEEGEVTVAEFIDSPDTDLPGLISTEGTAFDSVLEGVALEEPRYFMAPNFNPILKAYWHLHPPGDLSAALNADRAHRAGLTGRGIKVAMVDSGWFRHPYFTVRGYNAANAILGPGAVNPLADESGHGTGESANIFAVAPDCQLLPVKMSFTNSIGAFNAAVGLGPDIITCSWGSSKQFGPLSAADMALAASIASAVASGIIVIFSAGNGHFGFPGQVPEVISAGGVFMRPDETLTASNYASGFVSNIYPGRIVPDLSGLVGERPRAIYIMLPLQPNDDIDRGNAGGTFPNGDETAGNDGWAAFSGTSAAAPQLAGAAALIKQACPRLTPAEVKDVLMRAARDVTTGTSSNGSAAGPGHDAAAGAGLVDVHRAAMLARLRCMPIVGPTLPITVQPPPPSVQPPIGVLPPIQPPIQPPVLPPIQPPVLPPIGPANEGFGPTPIGPLPRPILPPVKPIKPTPIKPAPIKPGPGPIKPQPIEPAPIRPPITPVKPIRPIRPILPITPVLPIEPIRPITPIQPGPITPIPIKPIKPPIEPIVPITGPVPFEGQGGGGTESSGGGLSAEEAKALEDMIVSGDADLE